MAVARRQRCTVMYCFSQHPNHAMHHAHTHYDLLPQAVPPPRTPSPLRTPKSELQTGGEGNRLYTELCPWEGGRTSPLIFSHVFSVGPEALPSVATRAKNQLGAAPFSILAALTVCSACFPCASTVHHSSYSHHPAVLKGSSHTHAERQRGVNSAGCTTTAVPALYTCDV
jgi:hypothetical protein